jgi:hypothetical protein
MEEKSELDGDFPARDRSDLLRVYKPAFRRLDKRGAEAERVIGLPLLNAGDDAEIK